MEAPQQVPVPQAPIDPAEQQVNRRGPFWGSPLAFWLIAVISLLVHFTIYQTVKANLFAALGGMLVANIFILIAAVSYTKSLHRNATFTRRLAWRRFWQGLVTGALLGIPITLAYYHFKGWDTAFWAAALWTVALLMFLVHDVFILGMWWKKLPFWRFRTRSERPQGVAMQAVWWSARFLLFMNDLWVARCPDAYYCELRR